jgi:hypothetical protein
VGSRARFVFVVSVTVLVMTTSALAAPRSPPGRGTVSGGPGVITIVLVVAIVVAIVVGLVLALRGRKPKSAAVASGAPPGATDGAGRALGPAVIVAPSPPEPCTWKEKVNAVRPNDPFFFHAEEGKALIREMLTEASKGVESGQVKETTDGLPTIELRGNVGGAPFRAAVELAFGSLQMALLCNHPVPALWVERDLEKVPTPRDPNDPWEVGQIQRIFVGKGIFIPGPNQDPSIHFVGNDARDSASLEERVAAWGRIPKETQDAVVAEMARLDLGKLSGLTDRLVGATRGTVGALADPVSCVTSTGKLLDRIRTTAQPSDIAGGARPGAAPLRMGAAQPATTLTCKYCRSLFVFTVGATTCPNCGAAATAS